MATIEIKLTAKILISAVTIKGFNWGFGLYIIAEGEVIIVVVLNFNVIELKSFVVISKLASFIIITIKEYLNQKDFIIIVVIVDAIAIVRIIIVILIVKPTHYYYSYYYFNYFITFRIFNFQIAINVFTLERQICLKVLPS